MKALHINSGIILDVIEDDRYNEDYGTITLRDPDTDELYTMGGHEFRMEYKEYEGVE